VSQSVELPGSFPRAWPGPGTRRAEFGNFGGGGFIRLQ